MLTYSVLVLLIGLGCTTIAVLGVKDDFFVAGKTHETPTQNRIAQAFKVSLQRLTSHIAQRPKEYTGDEVAVISENSSAVGADNGKLTASPPPNLSNLSMIAESDWPKAVTLLADFVFPLRNDEGKDIGTFTAKAGHRVKLVRVKYNGIEVENMGASLTISADSTDFYAAVALVRRENIERESALIADRQRNQPKTDKEISPPLAVDARISAETGASSPRSHAVPLENQFPPSSNASKTSEADFAIAEHFTGLAAKHLSDKLNKKELWKFNREPKKVFEPISEGIELTCKALEKNISYSPAWMLKGRYHMACMELAKARKAFEMASRLPEHFNDEESRELLRIIDEIEKPSKDRIATAALLLSRSESHDTKAIATVLLWMKGKPVINTTLALRETTIDPREKLPAEQRIDSSPLR
jgi:hypothetical protein